MCSECRQHPCHPRCPNAPDPPTSCFCAVCGEPILVGEEYCTFDGDEYHEDCLKESAEEIIMEMATKMVAEEPYEDYDY